MAPAEFKLTKRSGITRRVAFPEHPTWQALATRISGLFDIPIDRVAVSYIDADDDEVTLNTDDELMYFYQTCKQPGVIKLFVQDLVSLRSRPSGAASTEKPVYRNTFGQEAPIIEDEWHIPVWDGVFIPEATFRSSQHGFVEDVGSDFSTKLSSARTGVRTDTNSPDKGRSKTAAVEDVTDDDDSSRGSRVSVFDGIRSPKQPIHVYDVSGVNDHHIPALAESTPRAPQNEVGNAEIDKSGAAAHKPQDVADDPPLPPIEPQTSPSLPDDLTKLFSSLCNVISFHPDVSDGFRSIIRNTSDGTYWRTHRSTLSRVAAEVSQASETAVQSALGEAEAEAGRRVYGALDALLRTLSQASGISRAELGTLLNPLNEATQPSEGDNTTVQDNAPSSSAPVPPTSSDKEGTAPAQSEVPKQEQATFVGRSTDWQSFLVPPPPPPVPRASHIHSQFYTPHTFPFGFGPPPPGPPFMPPPATGVPPSYLPFPPPPGLPDFSSPYTRGQMSLDQSYGGPTPTSTRTLEMADLRAKVQAAKSMYRAGKARYLQEQEQARKHRKGKDRHSGEQGETEEIKPFEGLQPFIDVTEGPVSQIISNARGPYPQLEMISIPGSFTPVQRHGSLREGSVEDFHSRAVKRICKQLGDMGFTESQHPGLADNVAARLPPSGSITKDIEDGIVTSLLEELIPQASPIASGSGSKGRN
ncbi:hypothetical protein AX15_000656 [Amanita polypyramis BW_CC]|nr:hypothetical protein AX15_000656 [Amanita polypyramis BW_CC]